MAWHEFPPRLQTHGKKKHTHHGRIKCLDAALFCIIIILNNNSCTDHKVFIFCCCGWPLLLLLGRGREASLHNKNVCCHGACI